MAQAKRASKGSNLKTFYWVLGLLAIVGVAAIAWIVVKNKGGKTATEPVPVEGALDPQALVAKATPVAMGQEGAPVKMLIFSDYMCPFCGQFASQIQPQLVTEFVNTGKLQFVYYDFPLGGAHKYSFLAARAARCAGDQNKFLEYHDVLFGRQSDWSFDTSVPTKKFLDYAADAGVADKAAFKQCVQSDKYQDIVSANHALGEQLGVNATPTLFVNGKKVPVDMGLDIAGLRDLINKEAGVTAPAAVAPATTTAQ